MKPDPLDSLLAGYSAEPIPPQNQPSTAEIWREIDRRRQLSVFGRFLALLDQGDALAQPRMALSALTLALVVGIVPAALANHTQTERRLARQSIHFEVFAVDSRTPGALFLKPVAASSA
ncbi:MAG: hypothetical protein ABIY47_05010, partial [Opitutaceae bacterium]